MLLPIKNTLGSNIWTGLSSVGQNITFYFGPRNLSLGYASFFYAFYFSQISVHFFFDSVLDFRYLVHIQFIWNFLLIFGFQIFCIRSSYVYKSQSIVVFVNKVSTLAISLYYDYNYNYPSSIFSIFFWKICLLGVLIISFPMRLMVFDF